MVLVTAKKEDGFHVCYFVGPNKQGFGIDERDIYNDMIEDASAPVAWVDFRIVDNFSYRASDVDGLVDDSEAVANINGDQLAVCLTEEGQFFGTRRTHTGKCEYISEEQEVVESVHFILVIGESYVESEDHEENEYVDEATAHAQADLEDAEEEAREAAENTRDRVFENTIFASMIQDQPEEQDEMMGMLENAPEDVQAEALELMSMADKSNE